MKMLEPAMVDSAIRLPGRCFICGGIEGRMVDTRFELAGEGRFYICERICLPAIGRVSGYLPPEQAAGLEEALRDATGRVAALEAELEAERNNKVVALGDVHELADALIKTMRPAEKPAKAATVKAGA